MNRNLTNVVKYSVLFVFIITTYQNCGSPDADSQSVSFASTSSNGDIVAIPYTKTSSIVRASRTLDTLVSCLGTIKPSTVAKTTSANNVGTISEEGLANSATQPMLKGILTIAAEVCNDLYNLERNQTEVDRKIFIEADFTKGQFDSGLLTLAAKRLSRSCWGRDITDDELDTLVTDIGLNFSDGTDDQKKTKSKMIYLCTAMASSFATFEM